MKIFIKSISTLLALLMMLGSMTVLSAITVSAAETTEEGEEVVEKTAATIDYTTEVFKTPEEALQWMVLYEENENLQFYKDD